MYAHTNNGYLWGIFKCLTFGQVDCISCVLLLAILFTIFTVGATWFVFTLQPKLKHFFFCWLEKIFLSKWYICNYWKKWKKNQKKIAKRECKKRKCIKKCEKKYECESSSSSSESECDSSSSESSSSDSSDCSSSSSSESEKEDKKEKYAHQKTLLHCPNPCSTPILTPGSTTYTWCVPECVYSISVTMVGGGGAGGNLVVAEPLVINGTGGQAGASFIDTPLLVQPGEKVTITVGGGGIPNLSSTTGSSVTTSFTALRSKAKALGLKAVTPSAVFAASVTERGIPSTITTRRRRVVAAGGLSGNDPCTDENSVEYQPEFGGFAGQCGEPGVTVPVSGPQPPIRPGKVASEGGNSAFARGGIPLSSLTSTLVPGFSAAGNAFATSNSTTTRSLGSKAIGNTFAYGAPGYGSAGIADPSYGQFSARQGFEENSSCPCDVPCRDNLIERDPNGSLGSGGAGQTLASPAGKGGDGFVTIRW